MLALNSPNTAKIAKMGAEALARLVQPNGRFIYHYLAGQKPAEGPFYNSLRHFGGVWAMLDVARQLGRMNEVMVKAELAARYGLDQFLHPCGDDKLAVIDQGKMKIGGNGLALLMLVELYEVKRDEAWLSTARKLANFIVSEQREDGDFVHSRDLASWHELDFRSNFFTGEVLFGLMRLYEVTGESQWLECVIRSEDELLKKNYGVNEQSHWMLYALDRLHAASPQEHYFQHAAKIAAHIVRFPAYRDGGHSTPIACCSEGLMAFARMLQRAARSDLSRVVEDVQSHAQVNLGLQLECRLTNGAFMRGRTIKDVRIDYIQHNVSSFLAYHQLLSGAATASA